MRSTPTRTATWLALLFALAAPGCERALKVDPELGLQTVLSGTISLADAAEPSAVSVVATNVDDAQISDSASTGPDGTYRIAGLPAGEYKVDASKPMYYSETRYVRLNQGQHTVQDFELTPIPTGIPSKIVYIAGGSHDDDPDQVGVVHSDLDQFVVEVRDDADEPLSNVQVIFVVVEDRSGGEMEEPGYLITDVEGRVRNRYTLGTLVGENVVRVQVFGLPEEHLDFTPQGVPDVPASFDIRAGADQQALVAETLPLDIQAIVRDQFGNAIPGQAVTFTPSGDGLAQPASMDADSTGQVQTTWTLATAMGQQTLYLDAGEAHTGVLAQTDHLPANHLQIIDGNNQSGMPNAPLPAPLVVEVRDRYDNPVDAIEVMYQVQSGDCTFSPAPPFTSGTDGRVSSVATPTQVGVTEVQAAVVGISPVVFSVTAISGEPGWIDVDAGSDQWGSIGETLSQPMRFRLLDIFDNPVANTFLHFEAGSVRGQAGSLSVNDARTDAGGFAETTLTLGQGAGVNGQWVTATATGFPNVLGASIYANVFADPASQITMVAGDNQGQTFGAQLPQPLVVLVTDPYANPVEDEAVSWSSTTGGSVSPNPGSSDADGLVYGLATLGSDSLQTTQYFSAAIAAGASVQFTAEGLGHYIDQLIPASVPPGYPDPADPDPENTLVPFRIAGGGFLAGATVVWDYWGAPENITPDSVSDSEVLFSMTADHFSVGKEGVYMVTVRNPNGTHAAAAPFAVTYSIPDSGEDDQQCTHYVFNAPSWEWELIPCADIQEGEPYYGQDGHYHNAVNQPLFVNNGDGTTTDQLTQMMWTRCAAGLSGANCTSGATSYLSQPGAVAYCQNLSAGGFDDWFLPSIVDLVFIADYGDTSPTIDTTYFPNPPDEGFWSSTVFADVATESWRWTAQQGRTETHTSSMADGVARCVRNRLPEPPARFSRTAPIPDEPIVIDGMSGLVWQGCPSDRYGGDCEHGSAVDYYWGDALAYCESLVWAGMSDWRLPQIKELFSIIDHEQYWPSLDPAIFPGTSTGWVLSATTLMGAWNDVAMSVFMGEGILGASFKDSWDFGVRCVRSDF